jgi:O-antigen ligase
VLFGRRSQSPSPSPFETLSLLSALVFGATLLLGGAGDSYPFITLGLELGALLLLWYIAAVHGLPQSPALSFLPAIIVAGIVALPLLQLVPIPPQLWQELPGRDLASKLLTLGGLAGQWRPMTLDPGATATTALEVLPGLATFFAVLHLPERDRIRFIYAAIAAGLISAFLGALQRTGGDISPFMIYETPHSANSPGLFVNRNHQATFLLIVMLLAAGASRSLTVRPDRRGLGKIIATGLVLVFAAGVVVTTSRTGFLLLIPAAAASLMIIFPVRWNWKMSAIGVLLMVGLAALGSRSEVVQVTLERFSDQDERTLYWSDTLQAIRQSWPVGTGLGTFPKVQATVQSVESVSTQYVNNAHNDYLELALEGGLVAVGLIALCLLYGLFSGFRLWRRSRKGGDTALGVAGLTAIGVVLLHSIFDYPLRMLSLMAMFGLLWGLVVASTAPAGDGANAGGDVE